MYRIKQNSETQNSAAFPVWPSHSNEEIAKVAEVLSSGRVNFWTFED